MNKNSCSKLRNVEDAELAIRGWSWEGDILIDISMLEVFQLIYRLADLILILQENQSFINEFIILL